METESDKPPERNGAECGDPRTLSPTRSMSQALHQMGENTAGGRVKGGKYQTREKKGDPGLRTQKRSNPKGIKSLQGRGETIGGFAQPH